MSDKSVNVIILAAQRAGVVNPLAARAGVSHKCMVPICGTPLIEHVIRTISAIEGVVSICVVVEPDVHEELGQLLAPYDKATAPIQFVASHVKIVESILAGSRQDEGPFIITTADNVLLTEDGFAKVRAAVNEHSVSIGATTKSRVHAAHPEGQRNFYTFKDDGYANCNIYGFADREALDAAKIFREGGQFQKNKLRMIRSFGLFNILLMWAGWITMEKCMARVNKTLGTDIKPVVFEDGSLAIDVDNERTYACCETILKQRGRHSSPA